MSHALKIFVPGVEFKRVRVWVLKTRVEIGLVNEVRTVLRLAPRLSLILRRVHNRSLFLRVQQSEIRRWSRCGRRILSARLCVRHRLSLHLRGRGCLSLRLRAGDKTATDKACSERKAAPHLPVELSPRLVHRP